MKIQSFTVLICFILAMTIVTGCSQHDIKDMSNEKIKMVPNEYYEGNPNPINEEIMKLTAEEQENFDQLKAGLKKKSEVEVKKDGSANE